MRDTRRVLILALLGCGLAPVAPAQTARESGGASAQLMQQLQQLGSERTALQAENQRLKQELEQVRKERDAVKVDQAALDRRAQTSAAQAAASARERDATDRELAQTRERMQELIAKFRETAQSLREVETDRATAQQSLQQRQTELAACVNDNAQLLALNEEVVNRLERGGFWAHADPFTRIARTRLQNLADDYRARAQDHRYTAPTAPHP